MVISLSLLSRLASLSEVMSFVGVILTSASLTPIHNQPEKLQFKAFINAILTKFICRFLGVLSSLTLLFKLAAVVREKVFFV